MVLFPWTGFAPTTFYGENDGVVAVAIDKTDESDNSIAGNPGPDLMFGWGSVNALRAGHDVASANGELVRSDELGQNRVQSFRSRSPGEHIRVTVVWADPAAPANSDGDDPTPGYLSPPKPRRGLGGRAISCRPRVRVE